MLEILDAIGASFNNEMVEDCHRIPSKDSPQKVIFKLSGQKDSRRVLLNKKKLEQLKPETLNWPAGVKIYINEIICPYYKKLWTKLWTNNENVSIITHDYDLEKLFPGDPLIPDTN